MHDGQVPLLIPNHVTDPYSRRVLWGARMSLAKDQGFRDTGTGKDKVSHVSRKRRKAESQVGREFNKT